MTRRSFMYLVGGTLLAAGLEACAPARADRAQRSSDPASTPAAPPMPAQTEALSVSHEVSLDQMTDEQIASQLQAVTSKGIGYYFLPHPDDEIATQALRHCADQAGGPNYTIMSLLTLGDQSGHCRTHGGLGSSVCKKDRLSSWFKYLSKDGYGSYEWAVREAADQKYSYDLCRGDNFALFVYDFGDQRLTQADVTTAINIARDFGHTQGIGGSELLVSSAFMYKYDNPRSLTPVNPAHPAHPDHEAVYEAIRKYRDAAGIGRVAVNGPVYPSSNTILEAANVEQVLENADEAYGWLSGNGKAWTPHGLYNLTGLSPSGQQELEVFELPVITLQTS